MQIYWKVHGVAGVHGLEDDQRGGLPLLLLLLLQNRCQIGGQVKRLALPIQFRPREEAGDNFASLGFFFL